MSDLTDPDIRPLWEAIAARLARGDGPASIKNVTAALSRTGQAMVSGWLARSRRAGSRATPLREVRGGFAVPVPRLLEALGYTPGDLRGLVEAAGVEVPDTAGVRRATEQMRTDINRYAELALPDTPSLTARLCYGISVDTIAERHRLIDALARARALLPLPRPVTLARLAHHCAGDPHYFDLNDNGHGDKLLLLARDLLQAEQPDTPAADRALLARLGMAADRLSQTVLVLGVGATGDGPTDRALNLARADDRPHHLTLHDLTAHPPALDPSRAWLVVENPSVVDEALMRQFDRPIVCTSGTLTAVDHTLLGLARNCGVPLEYSGDLDPAGHAIAAAVRTRYQATIKYMGEATAPESTDGMATPEGPSPDTTVIFQEHPALLDLLLGPCRTDPLAQVVLRGDAARFGQRLRLGPIGAGVRVG
ncbi:DUF2399 domain-containing protein [Kitasatospora sp. NPDC096128]|uniref:DUF2399 domain-containing protein n=1 Tax=Kitasatospora sp. NPDC096128 TaxID=3155547 RepID=UPI00331ED4D8